VGILDRLFSARQKQKQHTSPNTQQQHQLAWVSFRYQVQVTDVSGVGEAELRSWLDSYGLTDWWEKMFTEAERNRIREHLFLPDSSPVNALCTTAGWFLGPHDRSIAQRLIDKALELAAEGYGDILDRHFAAGTAIRAYYPDRDKVPGALEKVVEACLTQVEIAPQAAAAFRAEYPKSALPGHLGFTQLAILAEKNKEFEKALALCEQAKAQGWTGDWDKRIQRLRKKLKG